MKLFNKVAAIAVGLSLAAGVGAGIVLSNNELKEVKAETSTIIIDGSELTSTATTGDTEFLNQTGGSYTLVASTGAKLQSSTGDNKFSDKAILIGKSGAYIYNETPLPDNVTKFEIYANKGASAKVSVGVNFSATEITSYDSSAANTFTATLSTLDHVYDCSSKLASNTKYFWYQVTNANNSQVEFRITYNTGDTPTTYSVAYANGGATSGSVPTDNTAYESGATVTVLGNTGNLAKTNYTFDGWSDGTNTYQAGDTFNITSPTTLTAVWKLNLVHAGTESDPYTVADARVAIDASYDLTNPKYATGIVTAIPTAYSTQYSNITFNFVDEVGDSNFLQAYRCSGTDAADVAIGDIVVVSGKLKKFNSTYEFDSGCTLVSLTHPSGEFTISFDSNGGTDPEDISRNNGETFQFPGAGTKENYVFKGWTKDGGTTIYAENSVSPAISGNESYVAIWQTEGSVNDPYTVAEARAAIASGYGVKNAYASGIVSSIDEEYDSTHENLSFSFSVDGKKTSDQLKAYRCGGTDAADVAVGDTVLVHGDLVLHGESDYEFAQNCELITLTHPDTPVIDPSEYLTKVESTSDISGGKYLIAYADGNLCFDGSLKTLDATSNKKDLELESFKDSYFTISVTDDTVKYTVKSASGYYIGQTSDANGLKSSTETAYENTISFDDDGNINLVSGGAFLRYNSASDNLRFRYFKSSTYTSQKAIQLYKVNFAKVMLGEITCNSAGTSQPTGSWSDLESYFGTLSTEEKNTFKTATANESGTDIEKAMAKYDYIVGKYLKGQGIATYNDFIGRNPATIGASRTLTPFSEPSSAAALVVVVMSAVSVTAIGGFFLLKKKPF